MQNGSATERFIGEHYARPRKMRPSLVKNIGVLSSYSLLSLFSLA